MKLAIRLLLIVVSCALLTSFAPSEEEAHPPHKSPPISAAINDYPDIVGAQTDALNVLAEGRVRAEAEWAAGVAEAERLAATRRTPNQPVARNGDCATLSAELDVPASVLWTESRCQWVDNPTGCSGRGCLGPAQIDAGHFAPVSPWNPNVPGVCYGLTYSECARKLPSSAWG